MSYRFKMIEGFGVYKWTIDFQEHLENSVMFTNVTGGEWKNIRNPRTDACLLYTSPSPRDRTRSRMPSSA